MPKHNKSMYMKVHEYSKSTRMATSEALKVMPKVGSYRREGRFNPKTNHPGDGGANVHGIVAGKHDRRNYSSGMGY